MSYISLSLSGFQESVQNWNNGASWSTGGRVKFVHVIAFKLLRQPPRRPLSGPRSIYQPERLLVKFIAYTTFRKLSTIIANPVPLSYLRCAYK